MDKYEELGGYTMEKSELYSLLLLSRHPLYNTNLHSCEFKADPQRLGISHRGISFTHVDNTVKYTIPWSLLQKIRMIRDFCVVTILNYTNVNNFDCNVPVAELCIENLINDFRFEADKTVSKTIEIAFKFKSILAACDFVNDCSSFHVFYANLTNRDCSSLVNDFKKRKVFFTKTLREVRSTHVSPSTNFINTRFSIKSLKMLTESPFPNDFVLEAVEDFSMLFAKVPFKRDENEITQPIVYCLPAVLPDFYDKNSTISEPHAIETEVNRDEMTMEQPLEGLLSEDDFNLKLLCDSEINYEEEVITFNEEIEEAVKETETFFNNPILINPDLVEKQAESNPNKLPKELHKFLLSKELLLETLSQKLAGIGAKAPVAITKICPVSADRYSRDIYGSSQPNTTSN